MSCQKWAIHSHKLKTSTILSANEIGDVGAQADSSGDDVGVQAGRLSGGGILDEPVDEAH